MRGWWVCLMLLAGIAGYMVLQRDGAGASLGVVDAQPRPTTLDADATTRSQHPRSADSSFEPVSMPASAQTTAAQGEGQDLLALATSLMHADYSEQACLAGTAKSAHAKSATIHRWVDANGILHFSDQPPRGQASEHRQIEIQGAPAVVVRATGYDVNIPDELNQNAISAAHAIERVLHESLGVVGDPGLELTIEFIRSADAWAARAGIPAMLNAAGTYSTRDRTIRIRLQSDPQLNFLILRHEITHALVHERIGRLPTAINEGMASYFEHIKVAGMGAQIAIAESRQSLASATIEGDGQDELVDLLTREGTSFYSDGQEKRYLRAFGLVAMLMQTPSGRAALSAVLSAQREHPCVPVKAERILDHHFPGGLKAMALAWAGWLNNPPASVQAF